MPKEFVMRGKTASEETDLLNMGNQARPGYGYVMKSLEIYPSVSIGQQSYEISVAITADNTAMSPNNPDFDSEGLVAVAMTSGDTSESYPGFATRAIVNDLFVITQDLILSAIDVKTGSPMATNWQVKFEEIKLSPSAEAVANYKQYTIYTD